MIPPEHMGLPSVLSEARVAQYLAFYVVICRSMSVRSWVFF